MEAKMLRNFRLILAGAALWSVLLACGPANPLLQPRSSATPAVEKTPQPQEAEQAEASPTVHEVLLPDVEAGGATPVPAADSGEEGDPYVIMEAAPEGAAVGDLFTLKAKPSSISAPVYDLIFRDEGVQDAQPAARVSADGGLSLLDGSSAVLELVSAEMQADGVVFTLRAKAAGVTTVQVTAVGMVNAPGGGLRAGEGWGAALIVVK